MEEKTGKSKKPVLKRKHFILALIAVCAIAVIAEGVLLAVTFSKKKGKKSDDKKSAVEIPEVPEGMKLVWRVAKMVESYSESSDSSGMVHETRYSYDELGRLSSRETKSFRSEEVYYTGLRRLYYEGPGVRTVLYRSDGDGPISEDGFNGMMFSIIEPKAGEGTGILLGSSKRNGYEVNLDEKGRWESITLYVNIEGKYYETYSFSYDEEGRINRCMHRIRKGAEDQERVEYELEFLYGEEDPEHVWVTWRYPETSTTLWEYQNGRLESKLTRNATDARFVTTEWKYENDGFSSEYQYDISGLLTKRIDRCKIMLSQPSDGSPDDFESIILECETSEGVEEKFIKDDKGRVIEIGRWYNYNDTELIVLSDESSPDLILYRLQYDDEGRVISKYYYRDDSETTYEYDGNGFVSKAIVKNQTNGKVTSTMTWEYIPLVVPAQ